MAPRPILQPLITPRTMMFPSELHEKPMVPSSPIKYEDSGSGSTTAITPPPAYTEFLNALTPVFASPSTAGSGSPKSPLDKGMSYTTSKTMGQQKTSPRSLAPPPPFSAPLQPVSASTSTPRGFYPTRRLPMPSSPYHPYKTRDYYYTPSPRSAYSSYSTSMRSPYPSSAQDWKTRPLESSSPCSASSYSSSSSSSSLVSVRHIVTRTVAYRQTPALHPPPRGKRRKNGDVKVKDVK